MKSGPIKRHGGKAYLAPKIIALMPPHTRYAEPFFGGGSVPLQKPFEDVAEWANDLDRELTDFWLVLKETPDRMLRALWGTPLSTVEFDNAVKDLADTDRVKRATAFFIRARQSRQGLGKDFATPTSRLRRGMNEQVSAWLSAIEGLPEFHERLKRVEIRCQPAVDFIKKLDSEDTLFYADPPYLHETRSSTGEYGKHEMTQEQHHSLLALLRTVKGKVLLSGYRSAMYDDLLSKWRRVDFEIPNQASSAKVKEIKTECVWCNF